LHLEIETGIADLFHGRALQILDLLLLLVRDLELVGDLFAVDRCRYAALLKLELVEALLLLGVQNVVNGLGLDFLKLRKHLLALFRSGVLPTAALEDFLHGRLDFLLLGGQLVDLRLGHLQLFLNILDAQEAQPAAQAAPSLASSLSALGERGDAERHHYCRGPTHEADPTM